MTHLRARSLIATLALIATVSACDDQPTAEPTLDAANAVDAAPPDGDDCDELALLPAAFRPIASRSTGMIAASVVGDVTTATIDATAGGSGASAENPYIYLDLVAGQRVEVSDVEAAASTTWHVALKRASVKLNGGDSGPGQVAAARVSAGSLAEVTAAPATLASDDWASDDCALVATPGGEPATVMGDWYDYDPSTHQVSPKAEVWVIRLGADGPLRKLRIVTYYGDAANPMRGAYYRVEWAAL